MGDRDLDEDLRLSGKADQIMGQAVHEMEREASELHASESPMQSNNKKRKRSDSQQDENETTSSMSANSSKKGRFMDPVTHAPPAFPVFLTDCGHTVDASYLDKLANVPGGSYGVLSCPICKQVSSRAKRNYALEEELGLDIDAWAHPLTIFEASRFGSQTIMQTDSLSLRDFLDAKDRARHDEYCNVTRLFMHDLFIPEIKGGCKFAYYHNGSVYHGSAIHTIESLQHIFPSRNAFFRWFSYDKRRHEKELMETHGITMKVRFWTLDQERMKQAKKKGDNSYWFKTCTRRDVHDNWASAGLQFTYMTSEDRRNLGHEINEDSLDE